MITIAAANEWIGLYNDEGELVFENHSVDLETALSLLDIPHRVGRADETALEDRGGYPQYVEDVKWTRPPR